MTAEPKKDDCKCSCAAICGCAMKDRLFFLARSC